MLSKEKLGASDQAENVTKLPFVLQVPEYNGRALEQRQGAGTICLTPENASIV